MLCRTPHNFNEVIWLSVVSCLSSPPERVFLRGARNIPGAPEVTCGLTPGGDGAELGWGIERVLLHADYF